MSILEALKIVSDNAHGIKHNYFDVYLPAILIVNEAFPVTGYNTIQNDENDTTLDEHLEQLEQERWGVSWDEK